SKNSFLSFVSKKKFYTFASDKQNPKLQSTLQPKCILIKSCPPQLGVIPVEISHLGRTIAAPQHLSYVPVLRGCGVSVGDVTQ
ncbi:MAG: hypothetical protein II620_04595, partial [Paludibacteraceae bacterium]|nr:hypothetical protein [Paludibacteraceae bacterium]